MFNFNNAIPIRGAVPAGAGLTHSVLFTPGGVIMGMVILILIGVVIYLVVSRKNNRAAAAPDQNTSESAIDIVKERYAKGDISKDEFIAILKNLK